MLSSSDCESNNPKGVYDFKMGGLAVLLDSLIDDLAYWST